MKAIIFLCLICLVPVITNAQFSIQSYVPDTVKIEGLAEVSFVGTGDIQLALSEGKDISARTGLGGTLWRIWPDNLGGGELQLDFIINVASTVDTSFAITSNNVITNNRTFGNYILAPVPSGRATDLNFVFYFKENSITTRDGENLGDKLKNVWKRRLYIDGLQMNAFAASQFWAYDSTYLGSSSEILSIKRHLDVAVVGWKAGIFHEFIPQYDRRKSGISVRVGVSYIGRSIQSDAGNKNGIGRFTREKYLLNDRTTYHGIEYSLTAKFGNIRAQAVLPRMQAYNNHVPGLSGTQFITSISFVGGFPLPLRLKPTP
ncbi:hypothetical protein MKJ04_06080 [Pontibacter sp. E15-1]|uniref:hypothetical protein n=1 Tax=Pontibacter sp. E15-1 TaxID=2919918 RepID=UPI001F501039|nr:hypothetical protein [Pontibacter sp. E15-1]MCJ8164406.1 hypothetical protein [Pontibacter sp. E15-1]